VKGSEAGRQPCEEGKRIDGEREQQPAEEANAGNAQNKSDDEHGGGLRDKGSNGRAFHHHHGALPSIAERDGRRQRKSRWGFPPPLDVTGAPSGLEEAELTDDGGGIAIIVGGRMTPGTIGAGGSWLSFRQSLAALARFHGWTTVIGSKRADVR
jgi:hypothetical protein